MAEAERFIRSGGAAPGRRRLRMFHRALIFAACIALVGAVAMALPSGYGRDETLGLQLLFQLRGERKAPEDVVIVAIDEDTVQREQLTDDVSQWPHRFYADLVRRVAAAGAKVVALDVLISEPGLAEDDRALAEAVRDAGNVVLLGHLKRSRSVPG